MSEKIAVIVVTYNRLKSLTRLLGSLDNACYSQADVDLIISVDKSNTDLIENYAESFFWKHGNKIVDKHVNNLGLKKHILSLGKWFEQYDALVVLEDDLVVSEGYYSYVSQCVEKYTNEDTIAGISLYNFELNYQTQKPFIPIHDGNDVYFMNCAMSWGQVWLKKQWELFYNWYLGHQEFSKNNIIPNALFNWGEKSWLKYHTRYCIEEDKYFVYPYVSYTTNFSEIGVNHSELRNANPTMYQVVMNAGKDTVLRLPNINESHALYDGFFENKGLACVLGVSANDLCVNLNGENNNANHRRYYLTTEHLDFKILKSFGLLLRPIDDNIIKSIDGSTIYLYDTEVYEKHDKKSNNSNLILYAYRISNYASFVKRVGSKEIIASLYRAFVFRIKRLIKR